MSQRCFLLIVVLVLCFTGAVRLVGLSAPAYYNDEVLTYQRTQGTLSERLEHIAGPGNHVPLYFLAVGMFPHGSELELRMMGVFFSLLGVALFIQVTRALHHRPGMALWAGALVAASPYFVEYARLARPYPMVFFFALLASFLFIRLIQGHQSRRRWLAFGLASMAAYLSHYSTAALPLSQFILLAWLYRHRRTFILRWLGVQFLASLPTLIWLLTFATPRDEENDWIPVPNLGRPYYTLTHLTVYYDADINWYFLIALPLLTLGLIWGAVIAWREARQQPASAYWLILAFVPMLLVFLISQVRPLYVERYFFATSPAIFLLMLIGWQRLHPRLLNIGALVVFLVAAGLTIEGLEEHTFDPRDWKSSTAQLESEFQPGDGIILDNEFPTVFWHYYEGPEEAVTSATTKNRLFTGRIQAEDLPYKRLWLFTGSTPRESRQEWLAEQEAVEHTDYHKMRLYLVELP